MTATVELFDDFVRVRWGDLEPVARLVLLDPARARRVTVEALARLRTQWGSGDGRPVEQARRLVLHGALQAASGRGSRQERSPGTTPEVDPSPPFPEEDHAPDPVVAALVQHLREAEPLDRAVLATRHVWDLESEDVAHLLERPAEELRSRGRRLDDGLRRAHTRASAAAVSTWRDTDHAGDASGSEDDPPLTTAPSSWAMERDLTDALDLLLDDTDDPQDPAELVVGRTRSVRRRTLLLGAAGVTGLAGLATALALRPDPPPVARPLPAPTDRAWLLTETWPARGPLATEPAVRQLLAQRTRPADRVLWAGDVGTRRLVVVLTAELEQMPGQAGVRVFSGAARSDIGGLDELTLSWAMTIDPRSVVLNLPDGPGPQRDGRSVLIALAPPLVTTGSYSATVRPTREGLLERDWSRLTLDAGVATAVLPSAASSTVRVRLGEFEGGAISTSEPFFFPLQQEAALAKAPAESFERFIAQATGIDQGSLRTEVVADDRVTGGLYDDPVSARRAVTARVRRMETRTPDGAVLRSSVYTDEHVGSMPLEAALLVPADAPSVPFVAIVNQDAKGRTRALVLHDDAATVQLIGAGGDSGPSSRPTPTRGHRATVVTLPRTTEYGEFRVVLRDAAGTVTYDAVPPFGRFLLE